MSHQPVPASPPTGLSNSLLHPETGPSALSNGVPVGIAVARPRTLLSENSSMQNVTLNHTSQHIDCNYLQHNQIAMTLGGSTLLHCENSGDDRPAHFTIAPNVMTPSLNLSFNQGLETTASAPIYAWSPSTIWQYSSAGALSTAYPTDYTQFGIGVHSNLQVVNEPVSNSVVVIHSTDEPASQSIAWPNYTSSVGPDLGIMPVILSQSKPPIQILNGIHGTKLIDTSFKHKLSNHPSLLKIEMDYPNLNPTISDPDLSRLPTQPVAHTQLPEFPISSNISYASDFTHLNFPSQVKLENKFDQRICCATSTKQMQSTCMMSHPISILCSELSSKKDLYNSVKQETVCLKTNSIEHSVRGNLILDQPTNNIEIDSSASEKIEKKIFITQVKQDYEAEKCCKSCNVNVLSDNRAHKSSKNVINISQPSATKLNHHKLENESNYLFDQNVDKKKKLIHFDRLKVVSDKHHKTINDVGSILTDKSKLCNEVSQITDSSFLDSKERNCLNLIKKKNTIESTHAIGKIKETEQTLIIPQKHLNITRINNNNYTEKSSILHCSKSYVIKNIVKQEEQVDDDENSKTPFYRQSDNKYPHIDNVKPDVNENKSISLNNNKDSVYEKVEKKVERIQNNLEIDKIDLYFEKKLSRLRDDHPNESKKNYESEDKFSHHVVPIKIPTCDLVNHKNENVKKTERNLDSTSDLIPRDNFSERFNENVLNLKKEVESSDLPSPESKTPNIESRMDSNAIPKKKKLTSDFSGLELLCNSVAELNNPNTTDDSKNQINIANNEILSSDNNVSSPLGVLCALAEQRFMEEMKSRHKPVPVLQKDNSIKESMPLNLSESFQMKVKQEITVKNTNDLSKQKLPMKLLLASKYKNYKFDKTPSSYAFSKGSDADDDYTESDEEVKPKVSSVNNSSDKISTSEISYPLIKKRKLDKNKTKLDNVDRLPKVYSKSNVKRVNQKDSDSNEQILNVKSFSSFKEANNNVECIEKNSKTDERFSPSVKQFNNKLDLLKENTQSNALHETPLKASKLKSCTVNTSVHKHKNFSLKKLQISSSISKNLINKKIDEQTDENYCHSILSDTNSRKSYFSKVKKFDCDKQDQCTSLNPKYPVKVVTPKVSDQETDVECENPDTQIDKNIVPFKSKNLSYPLNNSILTKEKRSTNQSKGLMETQLHNRNIISSIIAKKSKLSHKKRIAKYALIAKQISSRKVMKSWSVEDKDYSQSPNDPTFSQYLNVSKKRKRSNSYCPNYDSSKEQTKKKKLEEPVKVTEAIEDNCSLTIAHLEIDKLRVLTVMGGLFYAGTLSPIEPPDVYAITLDGERGNKPHIFSREEILQDAILENRPKSVGDLPPGTRLCAYWSEQYRCLYPGTSVESFDQDSEENFINVEFDDGDSGRISLKDVRLLPPSYPTVEYDPNPLLSLGRKRRLASAMKNKESGEKTAEAIQTIPEESGITVVNVDEEISLSINKDIVVENHKNKKLKRKHKDKLKRRKKGDHRSRCNEENCKRKHKKHRRHKIELKITDKYRDGFHDDNEELKNSTVTNNNCANTSNINLSKQNLSQIEVKSNLDVGKKHSRVELCENKSKIAAFLPDRQLWSWIGKGYRRPGAKGRAKKQFFKGIQRGNESIEVGDSAVFLSTGRPDRPYIGKIQSMWETTNLNMVVKVKWFYHPEETVGSPANFKYQGALFESPHTDENDVQTISHKCDVLPLDKYIETLCNEPQRYLTIYDNNDIYYLAGYYDPTTHLLTFQPGVVDDISY